MLTFLIVISLLIVVFGLSAAFTGETELVGISMVVGFLFVVMGWGVMGGLCPVGSETRSVVEGKVFIPDSKSAIVYVEGQVQTITDAETYNYLKDKTVVPVTEVKGRNLYGAHVNTWYKVELTEQ